MNSYVFRCSHKKTTKMCLCLQLVKKVIGNLQHICQVYKLLVFAAALTLQDLNHRAVNQPNHQSKLGAASGSGLHHHCSPGRTTTRVDILLLCTVLGRKMQTLQAERLTTYALQLLPMR